LLQVASDYQPKPPRELVGDLSPELEQVIQRGLRKKPDARFQSIKDLSEALRRAAGPVQHRAFESDIGELMRRVFADRLRQCRKATARALLSVPPMLDGGLPNTTCKGLAIRPRDVDNADLVR
jgi:hypothetical protein